MDLQLPSGELDVPTLSLAVQASGLDLPLLTWGSVKRGRRINRGTWHFYTEDYRFQSIWDTPDVLVATECNGVVEPNISVFPQTPLPFALWAVYRKRWLARYWQEQGIHVWVDLNVAEEHSRLNLVGVPRGWRSYATHGYAERLDDLDREYQLARERCEAEPLFLVYGGGKLVQAHCREKGYIHSQEHRNWIRDEGITEVSKWQKEAEPEAAKKPAAE